MKTKGITIWERHAEKIVVVIALIAAIVLTALQFIGEPNAIQSGAESIAPDEIDDILEKRAQALLTRLGDEAPSAVEFPDPVGAAGDLLKGLESPVSPRGDLPPFGVALAPSVEGVKGVKVKFPVPELKAPYELATGQTFDALAVGVVDQYPELQEFFPDSTQPHDVIYATAAARYDLADLRQQIRGELADAEAADRVVIPSTWYNDRPENIVDVVVEREELLAGDWSNRVVLDPLPGLFTFRPQLADDPDAQLRDTVFDQLGTPAIRAAITRPDFYPTKNENWELPIVGEIEEDEPAGGEADDRIAGLRRRMRDLQERHDVLMRKLERLGGAMDRDDEGPGDRAPPGGGGGGKKPPPGKGGGRDAPGKGGGGFGMGGGGPGMGRRRDSGGETRPEDNPAIPKLKAQIRRVREHIARSEEQLRVLVPDEADEAPGADGGEAAGEQDEVLLWAHDLTVEPDHTYRYRFTVSIYNPFFGRKRSLVEEQEHLAESFVLSSAVSDWSDSIRINPPLRVFITSATSAGVGALGGLSLGQATVEVYRFYDGTQWMETFRGVEPGEYLGAKVERKVTDGEDPVEIDFRTGLFILDIVEDIDASRRGPMEAARTAKVLLQDARTGEVLELRDPIVEMRHPDRRRLREKVATGET